MSDMPFVDTHVHYYDLKDGDLFYSWLQPEFVHPIIGDIDAIKAQRYDADTYIAETRFSNVIKCVHVQAASGSRTPSKRRNGSRRWPSGPASRTPSSPTATCQARRRRRARAPHGGEPARAWCAAISARATTSSTPPGAGAAPLGQPRPVAGLDTVWEEHGQRQGPGCPRA